jgi:hypothetical protein
MGFKLGEVAKVAVDDKKTMNRIRAAKQNAAAAEKAAERIAKIATFARECIEAKAPARTREAWIVEALVDLMSGRSYSPREYEALAKALATVRREIATVQAAD